jgi:hypothetical protein
MKNASLNKEYQRLKWLIDSTEAASAQELELQGHWGRYLCVLVAGFLENAIREVYTEYARSASNEPIANYVASSLRRIKNPKAQRFVETARAFRPKWHEELETFLGNEGRKEAIDAIMSNRHLIAHGRDAGITVARVREYLRKAVQVVEFLEVQCGLN